MIGKNYRIISRRSAHHFGIGLILAVCFFATGALSKDSHPQAEKARPAKWAQPMTLDGVRNLYKVSETLYRGAQPTAAGMKRLELLGIKTVVNLQAFHSDEGKLRGTKLVGKSISMTAWHPEDEDVVRFLRTVLDSTRTPILVHCQHGADRTGTMVALYRIVVQGWTKEAALREMVDGGYGFHGTWDNLLRYISRLDIAAIKRRVNTGRSPGSVQPDPSSR